MTLVGFAVVVAGIVLLPLPGPGWLIIFAGLGILASEYHWAASLLRKARDFFKWWGEWLGRQPRWVQWLFAVSGLIVLAALVLAGWWFYQR